MSNMIPAIEGLSDNDLLAEVHHLTECERQATARLIAALGELDARRLYLGEGCSSLFTYCTQVLHLSEHAAYRRIEAARVRTGDVRSKADWSSTMSCHLPRAGRRRSRTSSCGVDRTISTKRSNGSAR
jgi:hypothetical protein